MSQPPQRRTMQQWLVQVSDKQTAQMDSTTLQRCRDQAERSRRMVTTSLQNFCVAQRATETLYRGKRAATKATAPPQAQEEVNSDLRRLDARSAAYAANWEDPQTLRQVMQNYRQEDAEERFITEGVQIPSTEEEADQDDEATATVDIEGLLAQLRDEPTNDAEAAAKFQLYETFAASVAELRTSLEGILRTATETPLPAAPLLAMKNELKSLDRAALNGVEQRPRGAQRLWIVHEMVRVIAENIKIMQRMAKSWGTKIQLCAESEQTACPVCLDDFAPPAVVKEVLSCCHAVCSECWETWSALQRNNGLPVFCPLCKQEQFTNRLLQMRAEQAL